MHEKPPFGLNQSYLTNSASGCTGKRIAHQGLAWFPACGYINRDCEAGKVDQK
jgi:hypothetical protein